MNIVLNVGRKLKGKMDVCQWKRQGCPLPPPHIVKQNTIAYYQKQYGYTTLIETGTHTGAMVEAQKRRFKKVISIELDEALFNKAQKRFEKDKNVEIMHGDSGKILSEILMNIDDSVIFWLDGHYSSGVTAKGEKETPILQELDAIFNKDFPCPPVLLIDDARGFVGENDYPTIPELINYIQQYNKQYKIEVEHDIIRCTV